MNRLPFTKYASKALNEGREIAGYLGFKDVSSIFILLGLYGTDGSLASEVLKMHGVTRELIEEAIKENRAYLYVNKEVQRVSKKALEELDQKDVIVIFPEERKTNKTVRIMKTPKTESSVRKVFLPRSVAEELIAWKAQQEEIKDILQEEYQDYGLILATEYGLPRGGAYIRDSLNKLIKQHDLPQIVFHSFRHMSVTYKLKLNGGDIKAVQGDSGHAQADMVTEVYSHIIDEDRRRNATLLEDSFYNRKNLNPQIHDTEKRTMMAGLFFCLRFQTFM